MASDVLQEKENFTRLSRLLVDKGTEALRNTFDGVHPPANLQTVLNGAQKSLLRLKFKVINDSQWNLLFPPPGNPPDSKTFDITLLTILLRNICHLTPPTTGWNVMPANTDRSNEANIVRLKLFRNEVHAHVTTTQVNDATFESLWKEISQVLIELNIPRKDVDDLKTSPLGTNEEMYLKIIKDWKSQEEDSLSKLEDVKSSVDEIKKICLSNQTTLESCQFECLINHPSQASKNPNLQPTSSEESDEDLLRKLAKHNFKAKIKGKLEFFHPGTREWLLQQVDQFVKDKKSRILFVTGGPGFGKSVFSAKVCHEFKEKKKLAACHFCDFSNSNLRDPMMMLQSLASQMCENIVGFKEKLLDQLKRPHKIHNLKDAFQIYLQNPLDEMELKDPILLVIDALDESAADNKSEIMDLINDYFPYLPAYVKVLVTGRPEISIAKLDGVQKIHIANDNINNQSDLKRYLEYCLPSLVGRKVQNPEKNKLHSVVAEHGIYKALTLKCEGSFLYAFYVQSELKKRNDLDNMTGEELIEFLPDGLDSIYQKYFKRLEEELRTVVPASVDVLTVLQMLAASKVGLPLTFISRALGLAPVCRETKSIINKVNETVSCLLYVSDDEVTVFHKSVIDWLIAEGYSDHEYTVKPDDGNKSLWLICEKVLVEIKGIICSEKELKLTEEVMYTLHFAFLYLINCKIEESLFWMADVAIIHAVFVAHFKTPGDLIRSVFGAWALILQVPVIMDDELRARISWHVTEIYFLKKSVCSSHHKPFSYLESVLKRSPEGYFSEEEKNFAESLLSKVPRFVESTLDEVTTMPLSVWLFPWSNLELERHQVSTPIIEVAELSHDKSVAAIAQRHKVISVVDVPSLVELWQYSADLASIPCCIFSPDDSLLLFGKLETALSISERKPVPFFPGNKETFTWCSFSPGGKRLVTSDSSKCIKLWDVAQQSLISSMSTEYIVNWCSFTSTGLFIIADSICNLRSNFTNGEDDSVDLCFYEFDMEKAEEDAFCVWNAITLQRSDERNLPEVDVHGGKLIQSKPCRRCFRPRSKELNSSRKLENQHFRCKMPWPSGIYNSVQCIFVKERELINVIENTHFTTLATYDISHPCCGDSTFTITTHIEDDVWFHADEEKLMVFKVLTPIQEQSSCLSRPIQVLSCCFSPDGSKLATCTSDGYINIWNVYTSQVEQRFESNEGESLFACWWSKEFLFVFDVLNSIPKLSKYPMDVNMQIPVFTKGKQVPLSHLEDELVSCSEIVDFSEGLLSLACGEKKEIKVVGFLRDEKPQMVLLPELQPRMHIVVSPGASFVFGGNNDSYYIWKRNAASEQDVFSCIFSQVDEIDCYEDDFYYETYEYESISEIKPITTIEYRFSCCFVNDSKTAIVMASTEGDIIDLDTGALELLNFERSGVKFCLKNSGIAIAPSCCNCIDFMDLDSGACLETSHQRYLTEDGKKLIKLSPTETMLAFPKTNGEMCFLPLCIRQSSVLSGIKRKAAIEYGEKGKIFGPRYGCSYGSSRRVRKLL